MVFVETSIGVERHKWYSFFLLVDVWLQYSKKEGFRTLAIILGLVGADYTSSFPTQPEEWVSANGTGL